MLSRFRGETYRSARNRNNGGKDGNIITGKGPAAAMEFALKIAELLTSKKQSDEVATGMLCK